MKVFNTLSGQKEEFLPRGDEIKMYVCGVTPYDDAHIGHAMSYIIFDVIRRYLRYRGYKVRYVQNVTDIDDKIINRANQRGISAAELAQEYTASFDEDMQSLNVASAETDKYPKATDEIPKIIEVIQGLVAKGYAYPAQGSVYFRVRQAADYGKLANRNIESMMAGARIEAGQDKEHPMDFTLWKASKPGEPSWESPWGAGRPGWHIECSAMSLKYLGDTLDIHGGGQDLIFPHHENEIAQSESFTGKKPFARYWLHNGLLQFGEEKMSKSLGNLITIKEALNKYSADAIRIFVLSSHYRSPLTYSEEALAAAEGGAERLLRVINREDTNNDKKEAFDAEPYRKQFVEAMDDDFNTPQALAILFDLARAMNQAGDSGISFQEARKVLSELAEGVLGLTLKPQEQPVITIDFVADVVKNGEKIINLIKLASNEDLRIQAESLKDSLVQIKGNPNPETLFGAIDTYVGGTVSIREQLRQVNQYQLADDIRAKLDELGITLEDTSKGTVWKYKR